MNLIEFHCDPANIDRVPKPYPAAQGVPDWFKQMPAGTTDSSISTVKRCPPFLEAMTCGYIIPLIADIGIAWVMKDGAFRLEVDIQGNADSVLRMHPKNQYPGAPFAQLPVLKFMSPWIIKTPPGYSTLVLPALNHVPAAVVPLAGLVETDTHYGELHFPAVCLLQPVQSVRLLKGSPLVQVIPVPRESWGSNIKGWDAQLREQQLNAHANNRHVYKDTHWRRKEYGGSEPG